MTEYSVIIPEKENEGYGVKVVTTRFVYDVSRNLSAVKKLCGMCNEYNVNPAHFDTVLEDFLGSRECF